MMPEQQPKELDLDDLPPGTQLCGGRFVIEACLGRGGVASVYRVRSSDDRRLALKLMVTRRAADGDQRERFENEWRILRALHGLPYTVSADSSGRHDDGRPFFTMELVEAPTLAELIAHREVTVARACWVAREVADALADLHMRGVVHRDIKPDNIMVTPEGVRLLDFGYAYTRGSEHVPSVAGLTGSEHRPGTPLYMAPEQADGAPPAPSFDVYALAATLHEALVGHAPYSDLPAVMMMAHKCGGAEGEPSIAGRTVGLSTKLEQLVDHGLRRRPAERVSAAELRDGLDAVLEQLGEEDFPAGLPERPERAAGVIEPEDESRTLAFLPAHRRGADGVPRVQPLRPAIGGGRGETRPIPAAVVAAEVAVPIEEGLEVPEDLQVEVPELAEDERAELLALREAVKRAAEQAREGERVANDRPVVILPEGREAQAQARAPEVAAKAEATRKWIGAAAVVLVLGVGAWWGLAREPKQAGASSEGVGVQAEAKAVPEVEVEPAPSIEPETEVAPAPEPTAEPEPAPEPAREVAPEPKPGKTRRKPKTPRQPEPAPAVEEPCTDVAAEGNVASRGKQWSRVLKLTKSPRCWDDPDARVELRVEALSELGRYGECSALGATSRDPEIRRMAKSCAAQVNEEKSP